MTGGYVNAAACASIADVHVNGVSLILTRAEGACQTGGCQASGSSVWPPRSPVGPELPTGTARSSTPDPDPAVAPCRRALVALTLDEAITHGPDAQSRGAACGSERRSRRGTPLAGAERPAAECERRRRAVRQKINLAAFGFSCAGLSRRHRSVQRLRRPRARLAGRHRFLRARPCAQRGVASVRGEARRAGRPAARRARRHYALRERGGGGAAVSKRDGPSSNRRARWRSWPTISSRRASCRRSMCCARRCSSSPSSSARSCSRTRFDAEQAGARRRPSA